MIRPARPVTLSTAGRCRVSRSPGALVLVSRSAGQTRALGRQLGRRMEGSELVALSGPLGAGKTCLVQGVGRGLGIRRSINSPSFVLMKRYRGRLALVHWDWYRLGDEADLDSTGYGDLLAEQGVVVIEWADRFLDRIAEPFLSIAIELTGPRTRRLTVKVCGRSKALEQIVRDLEAWWTERYGNDGTDTGEIENQK